MNKQYPRLERAAGLYLKPTPTKGRGVFCDHDLKKGTVLEVTPALILNEDATDHIDKTRLVNYTFTVGKLTKSLAKKKKLKDVSQASCVIMGLMSYCNHSEKPNAEILWEEKLGTVYHTLQVTRDIPKHTEICTSYGAGWFDDRKEMFSGK
jgi:SET domain-containing protein